MKRAMFVLLLLMALLLAVPASAEDAQVVPGTTAAPATTEPVVTSATVTASDPPASTAAPVSSVPIIVPATDAPREPDETLVAEVSGILKEWAPELLSGAALVVSIVLAYLFKKALLPGVRKVLGAIKTSVAGYNEKAEEFIRAATADREEFREFCESILSRIKIREEEIQATLDAASRILLTQSDSLFDLLEHSNLPAAEKAKISAKHKEQRDEIARMMAGGGHDEA